MIPVTCESRAGCSKIVGYADRVGPLGTESFVAGPDGRIEQAFCGIWLFRCQCGARTKATAPGWSAPPAEVLQGFIAAVGDMDAAIEAARALGSLTGATDRQKAAIQRALKAASQTFSHYPCRVDEMTAREQAIMAVGAEAFGALKFIRDQLADVVD